MLKIKNEKGITLIVLAITIFVLMIILSISINFGTNSVEFTKDKKLKSELEMLQQACISEYTKAKELGYLEDANTKPANFVGTEVTVANLPVQSDGWVLNSEPIEVYKKYFRLTPKDLGLLNILNTEYTYIVNYYTGEVYNETVQVNSAGNALYISSREIVNSTEDLESYNDWEE